MRSFSVKNMIPVALVCSMMFAASACSKKPAETSEASTIPTTSATIATVTTPSTEVTTLPMYSGPLATTETVNVTWNENELTSPVTLYSTVAAGNFLRVRKGPGKNYDIVGTLVRGQAVTVVASTADGWYKTQDGYYVSGSYLKATAPQ